MDDTHEKMLVLRWKMGDEEAFSQLFQHYHVRLRYYLRRIVESPEAAEDALQSTWLKVLKSVERLRGEERFRAWVYSIARNEALQYLRRTRLVLSLDDSGCAEPAAMGDEEETFSPEDAAAVHEGLALLEPAQREALTLRFIEGMPYEEIAAVTGVAAGTAKSRIYYAKRALRRILEEKGHGR